jgi:hypothetical protein
MPEAPRSTRGRGIVAHLGGDAVDAGTELDERVAREVMGLQPCPDWEPINFGSAGGPAQIKRCQHVSGTCYAEQTIPSMFGVVGGCPPYSADTPAGWAAMREVLAEMCLRGWRYDITNDRRDGMAGAYLIKNDDGATVSGVAPTLPEALCRAALAAVGAAAGVE